jgi:hypothetical protein
VIGEASVIHRARIAHTCTKAIQRLLPHIALFCPRRLPHAVGTDKRQRNETQTESCLSGNTKS